MRNGLRFCFLFIIFSVYSVGAHSLTYSPSMNHAEWRLELSPFECKMWQPIPIYGDAVFQHRAGDKQAFFLHSISQSMKRGKAALVSTAPAWAEDRKSVDLGYVPVTADKQAVRLGEKQAYRLLTELYEGMSPVFTRRSSYADDVTIEVALSSVNFRKAYAQYRDCLADLLPVNFEQIKRSRLHFITAKWDLTTTAQERLDVILRYVRADPTVTGFYIDGHTDDVGRRLYNLDLSKKRAETVAKYLVANGIDESLITTRYYGERYPVAKNNSRKNRAKNRRVTLRLERDGF